MRIAWNKKITLPFESTYGVLQGGVLSPRLFNGFLSDLNEYLDSQCGVKIDRELIMYLLFADDLIFFSQSAIGLQKQLNCFYLYCKLWHLIVSLPKTNVVIYNPSAAKTNCSFT